MAASSTDLLKKLTNNFSTTLNGAIVGSGDTSMSLSSTSNLPTDTGIVLVIDRVNASGTLTPTTREYVVGTVSGSTIIGLQRGVGNSTAQAHLSGAIVEQVVDQTTINDIITNISNHANQDGSLKTSAVQTALSLGTGALNGWNALGFAPATCTALGNRSYSLVFNSQDLTSFLSAGTRLRTTRTVAAPTQCTSLNGTTQFYSKTSPAGMTFTNTFTAMAWVKLSSYSASAIISRFSGTNGWDLQLTSAGQLLIRGMSASSQQYWTSYQSIPLNKWVHVAASMNMSDGTSTTNIIYIDGVSVPSFKTGTQASLTQGGNLEVGTSNATSFFPGKIAQAAVFSAVISGATILTYISQGLAGTETSLISAYSFNNTINDLNVSNANNLTANGSAVATNADSPFGGQAGGTISSTLDYGIIQSATFSTNTTLVVQVPEGCTIPTSGGVTSVVYSANKAPYGMPVQRDKWNVNMTLLTSINTSGTATGTTYNPGGINLNVPIGNWHLRAGLEISCNLSSTTLDMYSTVSTSSSSFITGSRFSTRTYIAQAVNSSPEILTTYKDDFITLAAATPYYILLRSGSPITAMQIRGDVSSGVGEITLLEAENAYL